MKNSSIKKFSLVGLLLVSASAVIAAILPSKNVDVVRDTPGTLKASTGDDAGLKTCVATANLGNNTCNISDTTNSTVSNQTSTENFAFPETHSTSAAGRDSATNTDDTQV